MASLRDFVAYICSKYPHKSELSKARLTKLVYLADWKATLSTGKPISDIEWVFNHYGPYVDDVMDIARTDPAFKVQRDWTIFGNPKEVIAYVGAKEPKLTQAEREAADFVIRKTQALTWDGFIKLVYSTYPVLTSERHTRLDLPAIARRYKADQRSAEPMAG